MVRTVVERIVAVVLILVAEGLLDVSVSELVGECNHETHAMPQTLHQSGSDLSVWKMPSLPCDSIPCLDNSTSPRSP